MPADRITELRRLLAEGTQGVLKPIDFEFRTFDRYRLDGSRRPMMAYHLLHDTREEAVAARDLTIAAVNSLPLLLDAVEAARKYAKRHCAFTDETPLPCPDCEGFRAALARLAGGR